MVDKISSWKYAEEFAGETEAMRVARLRADELGVECVTAATGSALAVLAASLGAKTIVEAGTGCGLSGLWLLSAAPNAVLATIDTEPDRQNAAKTAFADAKISANRTRVIAGRASEVMSNMADGGYDLVFLDADRETLEDQVAEAIRLVRRGGAIAIAHALWRDRVPDPALRDDSTAILRDVLRHLKTNEDFAISLTATGDGLLIAVKRA